ncbi:disease resistance protein At4g27190-like [Rhodamnia argentea]|uniref:Disease resistance protein At4g27190-like n=1 Tax=Rhodamnia argentea TaxID=178133 RepID=A0ABM3HF73_9MYRT|nr:disease resistance protein At4g27190-like [Rhodamnia argentea]
MSVDPAIPVASFAWDVLKWAVVPVKRQFGYVISSKSYAQDLRKEVGKLTYEAERIHNAVEVARNNIRTVYSLVTDWHESAEKALNEARELLEEFEKASKSCCYGTLPDPNCRYQFSRKAKDKIELLQRLARECSEFRDISSTDPAPGNVTAVSAPSAKDDGVFESRASIKCKIMAALADNRNSVVGVHGMGGTGKSTLLEEVERRIREERSFDLVAKADVSENPDIKRIQEEIAHGLGLSDIKKEKNVSLRAKLLRERLEDEERTKQENDEGKKKKKKVLIILDNLWKGLDLKSVGIPCGHDNKVIGCKLLLTSRFQFVLRREMGCDADFLLDALKEEEAKRLFERTVSDKVHHDPFKSMVDEALNKCAGLPFLIIAMANVFRDADFREWKDVLRQIEMSTNRGLSERINEMLQLSYNRFKGEDGKEVKSLLRLCVVYGVSKPSLENLVRYSVGTRLFREDSSMEEVRDRLSTLIQTLKASSFLLADEKDADVFKIHDLVRGFVASVASRDDPLLVLKNHDKSVIELPKDKLKSCTSVCFPYVDMEELPEELDCPEMRIFLLFTNNGSLKVPSSCFNSMRKLMVLHLSRVRLTRSRSPFQFLENLHTLCLNDCSLEDVAMISELKRLCVLSFANSKIQRLPKEIGQLVELRLLDLNHCSKLEMIEPGVLGSLMKLEELYMENSFDRWNAVEQTPPTNAGLIELNKLKNLYTLHVSILDPSVLPEDLNVDKLTKYQIRMGDVPRQRIRIGSSILELTLDPISDILQKGCIQTLLGKTDDLFLGGLNGIEQTICVSSQKGFPKLKHLQVKNSSSIRYVLQSPSHTDFKILESLLLDNLISLEKICNNHVSSNSFSALKVVRVENCNKMEVLFPLSLLRELPRLEEMRVVECHLMREIVEVDDCGKVELPNLRVLELRDLPNIKNFVSDGTAPSSSTLNDQIGPQIAFFNGQQVAFPSLETLSIWRMDSIETIWDNQVAAESFCKLKSLRVYGGDKLENIVPSYILGRLKSLESLEVQSCDSLEVVFKLQPLSPLDGHPIARFPKCKMLTEVICDDGGEEGLVVVFNQLKYMELDGLTGLRCFSSSKYALMFPLLEDVIVSGCPSMKFFSEGPINTPKLERVHVSTEAWFWEENLNITIQNMFKEMVCIGYQIMCN